MRRLLEKKYNAPLIERPLNDVEIRNHMMIQRTARTLLNRAKIPEKKVAELTKIVQDAYPNIEIIDEFLN